MKSRHIALLGATLVSFAVVAQDKPKQESSAQGGQTQAPSASKAPSGQQQSGAQEKGQKSGAQAQSESKQSGGQQQAATQQKGEKSGAQMSQSSDVVKQAQEKLSAAGHDAGPTDGIMGPRTQKALKDFQQAKKLETSGQLDQKTLTALGVSDASASTGASAKPKEPSAGASAGASGAASAGTSAQPKASEKPKEPSAEKPSEKPKQ